MPETNLNVVLLQHTPNPAETIALAGRLCYSGSDISSLHDKSKGTADKFVHKLLELGHLACDIHIWSRGRFSCAFSTDNTSQTGELFRSVTAICEKYRVFIHHPRYNQSIRR